MLLVCLMMSLIASCSGTRPKGNYCSLYVYTNMHLEKDNKVVLKGFEKEIPAATLLLKDTRRRIVDNELTWESECK